MPQRCYLPGPVLGRSTSLQSHQTRGQALEELQHVATVQLPPRYVLPFCVNPVNLETILRQIQPDVVSSLIDRSYGGSFDGHSLPPKEVGVPSITSPHKSSQAWGLKAVTKFCSKDGATPEALLSRIQNRL
jgi:hypothetical protein